MTVSDRDDPGRAGRRRAGASNPSGAAAPNSTVSQSFSRRILIARRETDGSGSISEPGCRITWNGCRASNSAAPVQAGAYTVTAAGGMLAASACTNDWIPPLRGGKSFVTIRTFGIGLPGRQAIAATLATGPRGYGSSDLNRHARSAIARIVDHTGGERWAVLQEMSGKLSIKLATW